MRSWQQLSLRLTQAVQFGLTLALPSRVRRVVSGGAPQQRGKMRGALAPQAQALPRRRAPGGALLGAARLPARRAAGLNCADRSCAVRVKAAAEGDEAAASGEEAASSSGRRDDDASSPVPASAPGVLGAVTVLRARLRAARESPVGAAVVGGGRAVGGWLKGLPKRGRKARLRELAKLADASSDNSVAEDAYLEALLQHRRVPACGCGATAAPRPVPGSS